MAEQKDPKDINQNPNFVQVEGNLPKNIRVVKPGDNTTLNPISPVGEGLDVEGLKDQRRQIPGEKDNPIVETRDPETKKITGTTELKAYTTSKPEPKPLTELELEAEKKRQNRTVVSGNKAGPFTFQATNLPETGVRSNIYSDADHLKDLARRLHEGFGLPGSLPGTGLGGQSRLDVATSLATRDWEQAGRTGSTVNGYTAEHERPTPQNVTGGWHERLAQVLHTTNLPEEDLKGRASHLGMNFGDYVDAMHKIAAHHYGFFGATGEPEDKNTFIHKNVNPLRGDTFEHPVTGKKYRLDEAVNAKPGTEAHEALRTAGIVDENGKFKFARTKSKFAGVQTDPNSGVKSATRPVHFGWNSKEQADGSVHFYHTMGNLTPEGGRVTPLLQHEVMEAHEVAAGNRPTNSREKHVEIAGELVDTLAPGSRRADGFSGRWRGRVATQPVMKAPHSIKLEDQKPGTELEKASDNKEDNRVGFTEDDTLDDRAKRDLLMPGSSKDSAAPTRQIGGAYINAGPVRPVAVNPDVIRQNDKGQMEGPLVERRRDTASGLIGARYPGVEIANGVTETTTPHIQALRTVDKYLNTGEAARTRLAEGLAIISGRRDISPGQAFEGLEPVMKTVELPRRGKGPISVTTPAQIREPERPKNKRTRQQREGTPPRPKIYTVRTGTGVERTSGSSPFMLTQGTPKPQEVAAEPAVQEPKSNLEILRQKLAEAHALPKDHKEVSINKKTGRKSTFNREQVIMMAQSAHDAELQRVSEERASSTNTGTSQSFAQAVAPTPEPWQRSLQFNNVDAGVRGVDEALDRAEAERYSGQFPRSGISGLDEVLADQSRRNREREEDVITTGQKRRRKPRAYEQPTLWDYADPENPTPEETAVVAKRNQRSRQLQRFGPGELVKPAKDSVKISRKKV